MTEKAFHRVGSMINLRDFKKYLRENWINVIVLILVLAMSAAASGIIYSYANNSLTSVSNELLASVLANVKTHIAEYLDKGISTMPVAKEFLEDRIIDTGAVANPDIIGASKYWGYFLKAANTFSLFFVDQFSNNLGWGGHPGQYVILLQWQSVVPGLNTYIPSPEGAIANLSQPIHRENTTVSFPPLEIARTTGKPYWQPFFVLDIGTGVHPLLAYVEPAYFKDTKEFCCIVGTNILVTEFENVVSANKVGKSGKIFIADDNGTLIADSNEGLQIEVLEGTALKNAFLPLATENNDHLLAKAAKKLIEEYGSFAKIPRHDVSHRFSYKGDRYIMLVGEYARENLRIFIVIVVPQSEFFGEIDLSRRITIGLTIAASILGALRYVFIWRMMAKKKKLLVGNRPNHVTLTVGPNNAALTFGKDSGATSSTQSASTESGY